MRHRIYINHTLVAECNTTMKFDIFNKKMIRKYFFYIGKEIPEISVGFMGEFKYMTS